LTWLHIWQYECTVGHFGRSAGKARRGQAVRRTYSTAQNTSHESTLRGAVLRRAASRYSLIAANCLRPMSPG